MCMCVYLESQEEIHLSLWHNLILSIDGSNENITIMFHVFSKEMEAVVLAQLFIIRSS